MAKYKVGDKVKVRKDLEVGVTYGADRFVREMSDLRGKIITIKEVNLYDSEYRIEEFRYWWTDEMFEGLYIEATKPSPQLDKSLLRRLEVSKVVFNNVTTIVTLDDGSVGKSTASADDEIDWWLGFSIAYTSACLNGKNKLKTNIENLPINPSKSYVFIVD